jgi:hypothetical protein
MMATTAGQSHSANSTQALRSQHHTLVIAHSYHLAWKARRMPSGGKPFVQPWVRISSPERQTRIHGSRHNFAQKRKCLGSSPYLCCTSPTTYALAQEVSEVHDPGAPRRGSVVRDDGK